MSLSDFCELAKLVLLMSVCNTIPPSLGNELEDYLHQQEVASMYLNYLYTYLDCIVGVCVCVCACVCVCYCLHFCWCI